MNIETITACIFFLALFLGAHFLYTHRPRKKPRRLFLHRNTGTVYVEIGEARFEHDGARCVLYQAYDQVAYPTIWARNYNEFHDGRFEFVGTTATHP